MKKLALLGNPLSHSLSPSIYDKMLGEHGLRDKYEYTLYIAEDEQELIKALYRLREGEYAGFNVTIPWKESVMKYLDVISPEAKEIGAVNTILEKDGKLYGYNTDVHGFRTSLDLFCVPFFREKLRDMNVVVLGAGGSSKAIIYGLFLESTKNITIINRSRDNAVELMHHFNGPPNLKIGDESDLIGCDFLINATPVGMYPDIEPSPLNDMWWCNEKTYVMDLIYNPPETTLLRLAKEKGAKIQNGSYMLISQAEVALTYFIKGV